MNAPGFFRPPRGVGGRKGHHAFSLRGSFIGYRTRTGRFGSIGPTLVGYGHDEVRVRNCLVALEQGKQFRAQAIAARCGKGVHGEKGDHDSETP